MIRLASGAVVAYSVAVPLVILMLFAVAAPTSRDFAVAAMATALYLPLHVRHCRYGLRGERPPWLPVTLGTMIVVIVGVTPSLGTGWLYAFQAIVASVLVTLRPSVSIPAVLCVLAGVGVWAASHSSGAFGHEDPLGVAFYLPIAVAVRAAAVFVLVWLVVALRKVQSARAALAGVAIVAERQRIDGELRATVVAELNSVVAKCALAEAAAGHDGQAAEAELRSLIEGSRRALANVRRAIGRYRLAAAGTEFERALGLLRAAGIEATVECPGAELPAALDEPTRAALRAVVARLLSEEATGPVVLRLGYASGAPRLEALRSARSEPSA